MSRKGGKVRAKMGDWLQVANLGRRIAHTPKDARTGKSLTAVRGGMARSAKHAAEEIREWGHMGAVAKRASMTAAQLRAWNQKGSAAGNHTRWHTNRGKFKMGCRHCFAEHQGDVR